MSTGTKAMGVVAALAAIAVGGYLAFGSHRPASRPASAPATTAPATPKAGGAPASAWTEKSEAKRMIRLRGADGKDIVLEGTPEEMKAQISKLPAELQDKVRGIIEKMPAGGQGGPGAAMGLPERATQQLQADAMAAAGVYRQLLESGKSPEEAKAIVEASLTDSLRKQITDLTGGKGNTNIKVAINGVPGGNDGKTTLAVMLSEEQTAGDAPPPPQASPTPSQGS